jgi:hypothetical protein
MPETDDCLEILANVRFPHNRIFIIGYALFEPVESNLFLKLQLLFGNICMQFLEFPNFTSLRHRTSVSINSPTFVL